MTKLADVILRDITANRPAAGTAGRLFFDTTLVKMQRDNGSSWDDVAESSGGGLSTVTAQLSSDVTTAGTGFIDGPSVSLTAGTWLLTGKVTLLDTNGASFATAKLWDGTTVFDNGEIVLGAANWPGMIPLIYIVTPGSTTTYKISAATNTVGGTFKILAAPPHLDTTNHASTLVAVRIG